MNDLPTHPTLTQQVQMLAAEIGRTPEPTPPTPAGTQGEKSADKSCPKCGRTMTWEEGDNGDRMTPPTPSAWGCECGHTEEGRPHLVKTLSLATPVENPVYPNLSALSAGCMSGQICEWPRLPHEASAALATIATLTARVRELEGDRNKLLHETDDLQCSIASAFGWDLQGKTFAQAVRDTIARAESAERERDAAQARLAVVEGALRSTNDMLKEISHLGSYLGRIRAQVAANDLALSPAPGSDKEPDDCECDWTSRGGTAPCPHKPSPDRNP